MKSNKKQRLLQFPTTPPFRISIDTFVQLAHSGFSVEFVVDQFRQLLPLLHAYNSVQTHNDLILRVVFKTFQNKIL